MNVQLQQRKQMIFLTIFFSYSLLQCWDECTSSTSINKSILDTWSLSVQSMVRDNSLVSTNIAWTATNSPSDCLVTWEVSGGGLIGNLLTQSSNVELSLWPETKYRVQVTCKNKVSDRRINNFLPLLSIIKDFHRRKSQFCDALRSIKQKIAGTDTEEC